ncbi:MAG: hypothetical protein Q8N18_18755 [Opitutaceae bacterium]|nr:hypothetical protein [Opitutaceae bacterium]
MTVSPDDAYTAKAFLYAAAREGVELSSSMLGRLFLQNGQRLRAAQSALAEAIAGVFTEAADWLEAAHQNSAAEVRWSLVTVDSDGWGRAKTQDQVVTLLTALAASGDNEAKTQLAKLRG